MDAITMLRDDHKRIRQLFTRFEKAGDQAHTTKRKIVDEVIEELAGHSAVEEEVFYPAVREAVGEVEDTVLESLEEHHIVKWTLNELEDMDPTEERFDAKVKVLMESVRHHMQEEEQSMFRKVRQRVKPARLRELGELMEQVRKVAPKRPHPKSPDEPPANLIVSPAAAVLETGMDFVKRVVPRLKPKSDRAS
jgi:hemerythrin superfamily protein